MYKTIIITPTQKIDNIEFEEIKNLPKDITHNYIVARFCDDDAWFWGAYPTKEKAIEVARELGEAMVFYKD